MEKEDKIISSFFGGVGDNLQFSTLPRRFSELGHKVYLSDKSTFRNSGIKELVWGHNPYILGEVKADANCGDGASSMKLIHTTDSFIGNWELAHGLEPTGKFPEIYYKPSFDKSVSNKVLMDITATSGKKYYDTKALKEFLNRNYTMKNIMVCCFYDGISSPILPMEEYSVINIANIFHYCNLIHSCEKFITLHSGGMVIASALKKYGNIDVDCLVTKLPVHVDGFLNHHHFYDNINYLWI